MHATPEGPAIGRLRWRCRRGMRELDVLLTRWLEQRYLAASPELRLAFERLLEAQDPQLVTWLFGRERPADAGLAQVIDEILAAPR